MMNAWRIQAGLNSAHNLYHIELKVKLDVGYYPIAIRSKWGKYKTGNTGSSTCLYNWLEVYGSHFQNHIKSNDDSQKLEVYHKTG